MTVFKRLTTSISASFSHVVSMLENHEALVDAAIKEGVQAAAEAKVQLKHVRRDSEKMQEKLSEQQEALTLWEDRATKCAESDREKARECLRRKKAAERYAQELEKNINQSAKLEEQLCRDLTKIDQKLSLLRQKKNSFKSRESTATALNALTETESTLITEIDDIFDRWDARITECETLSGKSLLSEESFEEEFLSAEEEAALDAELDELTK